MSYDQWKTASPWDDDDSYTDCTKDLKNMGKRGHGLCGKDADLDPGGQIVVVSAGFWDNGNAWRARAILDVYANICEPYTNDIEDENKIETIFDIAQEIILDENRYEGEWTGSDYWCFSLAGLGKQYVIEKEFPIDIDNEPTAKFVAEMLYDEIFEDPEITKFQAIMTDLLVKIDNVTKEFVSKNNDKYRPLSDNL